MARSILRKFSAWRSALDENGMALILVTPSTRCATSLPEQLLDLLDRRQGVFDDVVEEAGDDGGGVEAEVGEEVGHLQGVDQVGLAGLPDLAFVGERREDVRPPQQLDVRVGHVRLGLRDQIFESNHDNRCLIVRDASCGFIIGTRIPGGQEAADSRRFGGGPLLDSPFFGSLYWPGLGRLSLAVRRGRHPAAISHLCGSGLIPIRPSRAA